MNKKLKYLIVLILLVLLIMIRFYESRFFDDQLLNFFNYAYLSDPLPKVSFLEVYKIISLRFFINSIISILILLLLFPQKNLLKFLILFYVMAFFILSLFLYLEWSRYVPGEYLLLFYTRRLMIQPVFLFILIPALLFHEMEKN